MAGAVRSGVSSAGQVDPPGGPGTYHGPSLGLGGNGRPSLPPHPGEVSLTT